MLQRSREVAEELSRGAAQSSMSCWLRARGIDQRGKAQRGHPPKRPDEPAAYNLGIVLSNQGTEWRPS